MISTRPPASAPPCSTCSGTGELPIFDAPRMPGYCPSPWQNQCPSCGGTGEQMPPLIPPASAPITAAQIAGRLREIRYIYSGPGEDTACMRAITRLIGEIDNAPVDVVPVTRLVPAHLDDVAQAIRDGEAPTSYPYDPTTRLILDALAEIAETAGAVAWASALSGHRDQMRALAVRLRAALPGPEPTRIPTDAGPDHYAGIFARDPDDDALARLDDDGAPAMPPGRTGCPETGDESERDV